MQQPRIMRLPEVISATGYKRSAIYMLMSRGTFPKHHRIGSRAVGWNSQEIERWVAERLQEATSLAPRKKEIPTSPGDP